MKPFQYYPEKPRMQPVDRISLFNQLNIALRPVLEKRIGRTFQKLMDMCESPIEVILGAALLHHNDMDEAAFKYRKLVLANNILDAPEFALIPQFRWREFRIDFCIIVRDFNFMLFIECDGADFHHLNDEQRDRDGRRDAVFSDAGKKCLRFSGKGINSDAIGCALRVNEVLRDACRVEI
jgi:very-short-patch-repair endonuclease